MDFLDSLSDVNEEIPKEDGVSLSIELVVNDDVLFLRLSRAMDLFELLLA